MIEFIPSVVLLIRKYKLLCCGVHYFVLFSTMVASVLVFIFALTKRTLAVIKYGGNCCCSPLSGEVVCFSSFSDSFDNSRTKEP